MAAGLWSGHRRWACGRSRTDEARRKSLRSRSRGSRRSSGGRHRSDATSSRRGRRNNRSLHCRSMHRRSLDNRSRNCHRRYGLRRRKRSGGRRCLGSRGKDRWGVVNPPVAVGGQQRVENVGGFICPRIGGTRSRRGHARTDQIGPVLIGWGLRRIRRKRVHRVSLGNLLALGGHLATWCVN
jgi:hypothetical protein